MNIHRRTYDHRFFLVPLLAVPVPVTDMGAFFLGLEGAFLGDGSGDEDAADGAADSLVDRRGCIESPSLPACDACDVRPLRAGRLLAGNGATGSTSSSSSSAINDPGRLRPKTAAVFRTRAFRVSLGICGGGEARLRPLSLVDRSASISSSDSDRNAPGGI